VECATKNSDVGCDSPCDDTLTAATITVRTGGVSLRPCTARESEETKKNGFAISSDTLPVVRATVAAVEYRHILTWAVAECYNAP
jgi:hypothetical protein